MPNQPEGIEQPELARLPVATLQDVVIARFVGRQVAATLGFPPALLTRITTAISEVTRNIVQHAGAPGRVSFFAEQGAERRGLKVVAEDSGAGIEHIERLQAETGTGLGAGIQGTRRLMDEFRIESQRGSGTKVTMVKWL